MTPDELAPPDAVRHTALAVRDKAPSLPVDRREPTPEEREQFLVQLKIYLAAMYPGCPVDRRRRLLRRARRKGHYGRLGEIAGILVTNSVRHRGTDYERLLEINGKGEGLTRDEARMIVHAEVADGVAAWRRGSAETDTGYQEVLERLRRARAKGHTKRPTVDLAAENAALVEYLLGWLARRRAARETAAPLTGPVYGARLNTDSLRPVRVRVLRRDGEGR